MRVEEENQEESNVSPFQFYLLYGSMFLTFLLLLILTDRSDLNSIEEIFYYCAAGMVIFGFIGKKTEIRFFSTVVLILMGAVTSLVFMIIFYSLDK